jgi:hypothetical protein
MEEEAISVVDRASPTGPAGEADICDAMACAAGRLSVALPSGNNEIFSWAEPTSG